MNLHSTAWYAKQLKAALPTDAFAPARGRVLWLPMLVVGVVLAAAAISAGWVAWPIMLLLSLAIGIAFGSLAFVAHETLHGSIVRTHWLQYGIGFIGFLPFVVSPRLWVAWHNRVHHGNTGRPGHDPDSYPTLADYEDSRSLRFVTDHFAIGRRRIMGLLSLAFGFTGQSLQMLFTSAGRGMLSKSEHRKALIETALGVGLWTALAILIGIPSFLLVFALPLVVGNAMIMAFILTNHNLSPVTDTNDPLVNSLSVTGPRWLEWLTLNFGYHVEHHLFCAMSSRHAPLLRSLLRERWPERYQSMSLWRALQQLHRSPRVYKDNVTLVDPLTGIEWPLALPGPVKS